MSADSFRAFMKKVQEDPGLQNELKRRFGDPAAGIPIQELAGFAAGKGYMFTVEDASGELSDDQLGAVSGGAYQAFQKWDFPKIGTAGLNWKVTAKW